MAPRCAPWLAACAAVGLCGSAHVDVAFSPDGKRVAYATSRGLKIVPAAGGASHRLSGDDCNYPSWSPDGRRLAFYVSGRESHGRSVVYVGRTEVWDSATGRTAATPRNVQPPYAWREDGKRLAALASRGKAFDFVEYDADGMAEVMRCTLPITPPVGSMVWLPDTDDVAMLGATEGGPDVYLVEAGQPLRVTRTGDVIGLGLTADHRKLIWARHSRNAGYILMSVYTLDRKMRSAERAPVPVRVKLINPSPRHAPSEVERVEFSPDGERMAVIARYDLPVAPATAPRMYRRASAAAKAAAAKAAAAKARQRSRLVCYTMRMDGTGARYVCSTRPAESGAAALSAAWSADGRRLAVGRSETGWSSVWVFDAAGSPGKKIAQENEH